MVSENFKCSKCNRKFKTARALEQHEQALHQNNFTCLSCKKHFNSREALNQHEKAKHYGTRASGQKEREKKPIAVLPSSPIIVRRQDDLINEVSGFKCPQCGCEKAVHNRASSPLFSKRSHLFVNCSRCGKGFRDSDY